MTKRENTEKIGATTIFSDQMTCLKPHTARGSATALPASGTRFRPAPWPLPALRIARGGAALQPRGGGPAEQVEIVPRRVRRGANGVAALLGPWDERSPLVVIDPTEMVPSPFS